MNRPDTPAFDAPWQAQAFALAVALEERGLFSWAEWTAGLSVRLNGPDAASDGSDYYDHWLANLEALLAERGAALPAEVARTAAAWVRAAHATPHGRPILLENDPEHPG
ncbi:nitrile hydratase accessory protein [Halovulum dunhuangense]|uniref:nitrile hydratase accessory protein n=1 Tax=Halovulum dunhuangense TaxID=1505036 RepID=UPI001C0EF190|nr:nitrile hydratase accessory protein [Halovulum dunhuangense]